MTTFQTEIELPRPLVNQLLHIAQEAPEAEVCGLIGARDGKPSTCYPVRNAAEQPGVRFRLDPEQQIDAMRRMRERGEELFAIFHSHPSSPAEPSALDIAEAAYPDAVYLIISLNTKGVLEIRGYRMRDNQAFYEVKLGLQ